MDTLRELKEWVLGDIDGRVNAFAIADKYLVDYDDHPELFILPAEHRFAKPVVEAFAGDSLGYAKWLRKFNNDYVPRGSDAGKTVTRIAAKVQSRGINRRTRSIEQDAMALALRTGKIKDTSGDKARFLMRLRTVTKQQHKALLDEHRSKTKSGRLSLEERDELVTQFWEDLSQRIASGELPEI